MSRPPIRPRPRKKASCSKRNLLAGRGRLLPANQFPHFRNAEPIHETSHFLLVLFAHRAGDAVVHPAAGHRCHTQEEQHHKGQQGDAKPVSQFGQMRNQRHLAPFGFLASCGFSIFAHDVSALVSADASEAFFPAVFEGLSVSCAGVSAVASARS